MIAKHRKSINHAWEGISFALATQINYRVHILAAALTVIGGYIFNISYEEWLIAFVLISGGFALETINTSIEQLGDAVDLNYNIHIKRAKDLAAGAMLFYSCGALLVACIIFLPKILRLLVN